MGCGSPLLWDCCEKREELETTCTFSSKQTFPPSPVSTLLLWSSASSTSPVHHNQADTHITPFHPNHSQRRPAPSASRMHPIPSHQSPLFTTPLLVATLEKKNKLLPSPSAEQRPGTPRQNIRIGPAHQQVVHSRRGPLSGVKPATPRVPMSNGEPKAYLSPPQGSSFFGGRSALHSVDGKRLDGFGVGESNLVLREF